MTNSKLTPSIGSATSTTKTNQLGDTLTSRLGTLLAGALTEAASLEVRTFTSASEDMALATTGDPLAEHTRLRAFTRIAMDGDTQQCIPLGANGEPDETLWKLHTHAVEQARKDRAASLEIALSTLRELAGR